MPDKFDHAQVHGLTIASLAEDFTKVTALVRAWANERNLREVDCGAFHLDRQGSPGCLAVGWNLLQIFVLFEPAVPRTKIEFFEPGSTQSDTSKTAVLELRQRLAAEFGDKVQDAPW